MSRKIKKNVHGIILLFLISIFISMVVSDFISVPLHGGGYFQCIDGDCNCRCRVGPRATICECERGGYVYFYYCYCWCDIGGSYYCQMSK